MELKGRNFYEQKYLSPLVRLCFQSEKQIFKIEQELWGDGPQGRKEPQILVPVVMDSSLWVWS